MNRRSAFLRAAPFHAGAALAAFTLSCGGSSSGPAAPSPPPAGDAPTVTITSAGVEPREVSIGVGQAVRFVNNDSQAREIASNPHLAHTDCPAINQVGLLNPGQSRLTGTFSQARVCGYHEHLSDNTLEPFRGRILVGGAQPGPGDPY